MITNLREPHNKFINKTGQDISYEVYSKFINAIFKKVVDKVLLRQYVNLGNGLGSVVIENTFRKKGRRSVDFGATRKNMNEMTEEQIENKEHIVYRTNNFYDKFKWKYDPWDNVLKCYKFNLVKQVKNRINENR